MLINPSLFSGYFADRPLPSSGVIPFFRGWMCELNNSCSGVVRDSYHSDELLQLTNLGSDFFEFANRPDISKAVNSLVDFSKLIIAKRAEATTLANSIKLSEVLLEGVNGPSVFENLLTQLTLYPSPINSTYLSIILDSNPNFNFLYSNYSNNYSEPLKDYVPATYVPATVPSFALNVLYGESLEVSFSPIA